MKDSAQGFSSIDMHVISEIPSQGEGYFCRGSFYGIIPLTCRIMSILRERRHPDLFRIIPWSAVHFMRSTRSRWQCWKSVTILGAHLPPGKEKPARWVLHFATRKHTSVTRPSAMGSLALFLSPHLARPSRACPRLSFLVSQSFPCPWQVAVPSLSPGWVNEFTWLQFYRHFKYSREHSQFEKRRLIKITGMCSPYMVPHPTHLPASLPMEVPRGQETDDCLLLSINLD